MQRAIIDGCKTTGVTTMFMAEGLDTGDMLLKAECEIAPNDNFEDIHDRLGALGADLLIKTVDGLAAGTLTRIPQDDSLSTYAEKISKAECLIDFSRPAEEIHNKIRGLSPVPLSFTHTRDTRLLKVKKSEVRDTEIPHENFGEVLSVENGKITVACGTGSIDLLTVLPEGKGMMSAADFIRGRKIDKGDILA